MKSAQLLTTLAIALAVGLATGPVRATSDQDAVTLSGTCLEYESLTPQEQSLQLQPTARQDSHGVWHTYMTNGCNVFVNTNTTWCVAVQTLMQIKLWNGPAYLDCYVDLSAPLVPPPYHAFMDWDFDTGMATEYLQGYSDQAPATSDAAYTVHVQCTVPDTVWMNAPAGGTYTGLVVLTVGPAHWPVDLAGGEDSRP